MGYINAIRFLLVDPRVDQSANDNFAIRWASQNGNKEVVKILLVDPSAKDNEAIRSAFKKGEMDIVKILSDDPRVDSSVIVIRK
jgi:hypothetical protein